MTVCSVCGGHEFRDRRILWPELIAQWELRPEEVEYIDRQQGRSCTGCGASLRSIALAKALLQVFHSDLPLAGFVHSDMASSFRVLEINEAGSLTSILSQMPQHRLVRYPEHDMLNLSFSDGGFDLVVHSDTLEHVVDPVRGLAECRRVLAPGGALCFTVPIVIGRMTRDRTGRPRSFHGDPSTTTEDLLVHTEFGADAWTMVARAGFTDIAITSVEFPAAIALTARRGCGEVAEAARPQGMTARDAEIGRLGVLVAEQAAILESMRSSTSWRVTAPMRFVTQAGRRLLRRFGVGTP